MNRQAGIFNKIWNRVVDFFTGDVDDLSAIETEVEEGKEIEEAVGEAVIVEERGKTVEESEREEQEENVEDRSYQDKEDVIVVERVVPEKGEVKVNDYKLSIPDNLVGRFGDVAVDHSFSALDYLLSLGYETFDFYINPVHSHIEDICDDRAANNPWDVEGVLKAAETDADTKGYPIAPIFWLTHPNCKGYLVVHSPASADEIPNTAPGLSVWNNEEQTLAEKEELFPNLIDITVDRYTLAPKMFVAVSMKREEEEIDSSEMGFLEKMSIDENIKKADESWVDEIKPVRTKRVCFLGLSMDFVQVIPKGFNGIQTEIYNNVSKVFFPDLYRTLTIPKESLEVMDLVKSNSDPDEGAFVLLNDGSIAVAMGMIDKELLVYFPEFDDLVGVDLWTVLEMK